MKAECIVGAHTSFHFFWRRVLELAGNETWCYTRGDLAANIEELKTGPEPTEPTSNQLWQLAHLGYPVHLLILTLKLLAQVAWTTLPCEQFHGSLSVFRRWHPEFGPEPLVGRSLVLQFARILVPQISKAERELAKTQAIIRKLGAKPQKGSGLHQLVADIP